MLRTLRSAILLLPVIASCSAQPPATVAIASPAGTSSAAPSTPPATLAEALEQAAPVPAEKDDEEPVSTNARGWLGVELEPAAPDESGVRIGRIVPKSPAARSGLLPGDLVQRLDNEAVGAPPDVVRIVSGRRAGSRVGVMLIRQGAERLVSVTLGAAPEQDEIFRMSVVDQPAPPFELLQTAAGTFTPSLSAQRGQVLVVEFWAPWCVACRALIPHMNEWHARYAGRGLRVVGITTDPVPRAASAARQLGLEFPVASDASGKTTIAYQARAIPAVFVIDRAGTVRDVMVGFDAERLPKLDALVERLIAER